MSKSIPLKRKDYTSGPLFFPILKFAASLMLANMLQASYNFADKMVVGKFSGDPNALASMACTSSISTLLVVFVTGLSAGTSVVVARAFGAKNDDGTKKAIHTSLMFALVAGLVVAAVCPFLVYPLLRLTGAQSEYIDGAAVYLTIILVGYPFSALQNFAGASIRALGDSFRPTVIVGLSGFINVVLNIVFVAILKMGVAGVALATVVANASASVLLLILLARQTKSYAFRFKRLRFDFKTFRELFGIGFPSCIQTSLVSLAGLVSTRALNSLEVWEINGYSANGSIISFMSIAIGGFTISTMLTFVGQNYGAKNYERMKRSLVYCIVQFLILGGTIVLIEMLLADPLARLFVDTELDSAHKVISAAKMCLFIALPLSIPHGIANSLQSYLRATGYSILPLITSVVNYIGFSLIYYLFIFPKFGNLLAYFMGEQLCGVLNFLVITGFYIAVIGKIKKKLNNSPEINQT